MKILIAAGGTGGHLFPALRFAEEIKERNAGAVLFVTSCKNQDTDILKESNMPHTGLPVIGFQSRKVPDILNFSARLAVSFIRSLFVLLRFNPDIVVGFGGYVSGPVLFSAVLLRKKTVIHEQNVYPGKTNRILSRFVDKIAVSFQDTNKYFKKTRAKVIVSGNLLRKGFKRIRKSGNMFTILVIGGSQGAVLLNKLVPEAMGLIDSEKKKNLKVLHISGKRDTDEERVISAYKNKDMECEVFSFTREMHKLYNESDFVIGRAGATTISELLYMAKPSILIPYPHGNGHQLHNAGILEKAGLAVVFEEKKLSADILREAVEKFMNRDLLNKMSDMAGSENIPDACDVFMNNVILSP
jgi:UDP-N-acetylglucosamine--N-acetylmuramyl-(pentapeptide) pyrophosphoryl-undecaprenol N-acetylglucosamine transferase